MTTSLSTRWRSPFGALFAMLIASCGSNDARPGELMLAITTDMAVPNDLERIAWSITLDGDAEAYARGSIRLHGGSDLPATLAVEAGPRTSGPITVRVEGWKGESTSPRVSREARLVVPRDRVTQLELPLSWLCSRVVLSEPCGQGTTCRGGHCEDVSVDPALLPRFSPAAEHECFDVAECVSKAELVQAGPMTLESGREVPCALSGSTLLGPSANVSLAIEVRNDLVGNYGFCGPFNECFIPLDRSDTSEGWRVLDNGDVPTIELPAAVCENAGISSSRVAVGVASERCPAERGARPLCSPLERACLSDESICPAGVSADGAEVSDDQPWIGYACSDVLPQEVDEELLKCWQPNQPTADAALPTDGRWCCLERRESVSGPVVTDPLLIDDMRGGSQIKIAAPAGVAAGWWHTGIPNGSGHVAPAPGDYLYTYRKFDEPVGPPGGPTFRAAACLSSTGFQGWLALQGFFLLGSLDDWRTVPVDVSEYAGISFWGWAHEPFPAAPLGVSVSFPNVQTSLEVDSECSVAEPGGRLCDNFFREVALSATWKHYVVRWDELAQTQYDWGQLRFRQFKPQINGIYFSVPGAGPSFMSQPFEFCVTDLRFVPKDEEAAHESPG